jgi:hypothetical protein
MNKNPIVGTYVVVFRFLLPGASGGVDAVRNTEVAPIPKDGVNRLFRGVKTVF